MFSQHVKNKWRPAAVLLVAIFILHLPQGPTDTGKAAKYAFEAIRGEPLYAAPADEKQPGGSSALVFQLNETFQKIAGKVTPTVVSITSSRARRSGSQPQAEALTNMGSGVIVSGEGLILTNNHVIENADDIKIVLLDGRVYTASVTGADYTTDLAVLKVRNLEPGARLPAIRFGDSDSCQIGAWVLAIGNPMELGLSVTGGIISAKNRKIDILSGNPLNVKDNIDSSIESFIQTDAVINPGNSGGALVNLRGELIGINTAIASTTGVYQGYGFAIPINLARRVMEDLVTLGRVVRPVLGTVIQSLEPVEARALGMESPQGILVEDFNPRTGSPAELGGLERGDVIVSVDNRKVNFPNQLQETIAKYRPGDIVQLTVFRSGQFLKRSVRLGKREITGQREPVSAAGGKPLRQTSTLGIRLREINREDMAELGLEEDRGVLVDAVTRGGPAARAGFLPGDVILTINRQTVDSVEEVLDSLDDISSGTAVLFMVTRGGATRFIGLETP